MRISGNTLLIRGETSGIGRALAETFHAEGNRNESRDEGGNSRCQR
jgi:short-subunit dehydrogenase involved in D-alanine esterification of teichoic acids